MANIIKLKRSETAGSVPASGDLEVGEICINIADGIFYTKNASGNIVTVSDKTTGQAELELTSTDAGSSAGPGLDLFRNSFSPFASDELGKIDFSGENDNSDKKVFAKLVSKINDATNTTEVGELEIHVINSGTVENVATIKSDGIHLSTGKGVFFADGTSMLTTEGLGSSGEHTHTALAVDGTVVQTSETEGHSHTLLSIDGTVSETSTAGQQLTTSHAVVMSIALG